MSALFDLPKFWRSPNEPSEADGVKEGFRSGGLDFVHGFRDGISGLVMTPMRRYKEAVSWNDNTVCLYIQGWPGLMLGVLQSWLDFVIKGMAGVLRLWSQPVKGMVFAAKRRDWNKGHPWLGPSRELGKTALRNISSTQRKAIIESFRASESSIEERRQELKEMKADQIKSARQELSDLPQWIGRH